MARLAIVLLGPFQATLDGQPITTFRSDKVRALLAYLAVETTHPHARDTLAALLWPDWPEEYARHSLRSALANLRQAIGDSDAVPPHLLITRETIQFNRESDHSLDVAVLLECSIFTSFTPPTLERLREAAVLYRGDFLESLSIADSAAYEEWASQQRQHLRQRALGVLHRLAEVDLEAGDTSRAESYARRCLQLDPWDEQAHRQLMLALALQGQRSAALAQFEACRRALAEELNAEPEPETTHLWHRIRAGALAVFAPKQDTARDSQTTSSFAQTTPSRATTTQRGGRSERAADDGSAKPREPHSPANPASGVFVGRQREMGELKAALEEALSGRGRLMMLVGEPGIGKTHMARELAAYAGLRWAQVLWGRCYESPGAPPYWPWVQAIRAYVREHAPAQVQQEMGSGAPEIAQIVAEVRQRLPDVPPPPAVDDPESARFRLFDAVTTFLKSAAQAQPLVLILDDLHWADRSSLLLLQFLAGELASIRLLMVGCYRDAELSRKHPLAQALGELTRERGFQRVLLRGLTQENVARFIELTAGLTPPLGLVQAVYTQTEGNPLFISEVVRLLVQEGELAPEKLTERTSWTMRIPEGAREVIGRRLSRLSERCNEVLTVAALIGREFTLAELGLLVEDLSEDRLLDVLEEGLAVRAIEEMPRTVGRYQFTHGLIQETLVQDLSAARRVRLHARIAQGLEALYGDEAVKHAAELAYHYGEAESILGTAKLMFYSLLAGERARASYSWEEAVAHFQRGLAAREGQPMDDDTAGLLFSLGHMEMRLHSELDRPDIAIGHMRRAFDYYERTGNGPFAAAIIEHELPWRVPPAEGVDLAQRALRLVPPDSREAAQILTVYALRDYDWRTDYEAAREAMDRALEIARRQGDASLEMSALERGSFIAREHLRGQRALDLLQQALSRAAAAGRPWTEVQAHGRIAAQLLQQGEPARARQHAEEAVQIAGRIRVFEHYARRIQAHIAYAQGDLNAARALLEPVTADLFFTVELSLLAANTSGYGAAVPKLERVASYLAERGLGRVQAYSVAPYLEMMALVASMAGVEDMIEFARASAQKALADPGTHPLEMVSLSIALGLIAIKRDGVQEVRSQYQALLPHAGMASPGSGMLLDRLLGLLAGTMGELDRAAEHFDDALAFARKGGYRPELAWTCRDYADLLLSRNAPGDSERAAALLDEALALAQEMGMRPLVERVQARRGT